MSGFQPTPTSIKPDSERETIILNLEATPSDTFPKTIEVTGSFGTGEFSLFVLLIDKFGTLLRFQPVKTKGDSWGTSFPDISFAGKYQVQAFANNGKMAQASIEIPGSALDDLQTAKKIGSPEITIEHFQVSPANQSPANITVWGKVSASTFVSVLLKRGGGG